MSVTETKISGEGYLPAGSKDEAVAMTIAAANHWYERGVSPLECRQPEKVLSVSFSKPSTDVGDIHITVVMTSSLRGVTTCRMELRATFSDVNSVCAIIM